MVGIELQMINPTFFQYFKDVATATNSVAKMGQNYLPPALIALLFETEWDIATLMCALKAQMTPLYRVRIS